ncbi:hypothetical protein JQX13_05890 [Archangium violaceum]|uniref:hypothetical protein n=1 Tax=Archangium violaceum TaxID=83451 RepID=UPI00193B522D|nr:hypothetical protein JQX13_05890 [Archangium violaceum]
MPGDVSRVTVSVSVSDMASLSTELVITDGAWGGILGDIPADPRRTFLAQAFTASNTLRYEGRAEDVSVTAGSMGLVTLTLQDVSVPPPFGRERLHPRALSLSETGHPRELGFEPWHGEVDERADPGNRQPALGRNQMDGQRRRLGLLQPPRVALSSPSPGRC